MVQIKPLDTININSDGSGSFNGENAVNVYKLAHLASMLKLELAYPSIRMTSCMSALKAAKITTGLRTNKREVQLERILVMLDQAKSQVVYLETVDINEIRHE